MNPDFRFRYPLLLLIVITVLGAMWSLLEASWFVARLGDDSIPLSFSERTAVPALESSFHPALKLMVFLPCLYFFVRLLGVAMLLLLKGPTTGKVAWLTPTRARVQGLLTALPVLFAVLSVPRVTIAQMPVDVSRAWGGWLLIACLCSAQLVLHLIADDPFLANTQGWLAAKRDEK